MVLNDEAHHVHDEKLAWTRRLSASTLRWRAADGANAGVVSQFDYSATPKYERGALFRHMVVEYPLAQAVGDGIVKTPDRPTASLALPHVSSTSAAAAARSARWDCADTHASGIWYTSRIMPDSSLLSPTQRAPSTTEPTVVLDALPSDWSMAGMAYDALREAILAIDIYSSDVDLRLDEKQLAAKLGVSRTPVRDALARLEQEGLVRIVPRRGAYVVRKSKAEIVEMITGWAALESMAARLATTRASDEEIAALRDLFKSFQHGEQLRYRLDEYSAANLRFHQAVIDIGHSPVLSEMAASLLVHMRAIRGRTIRDDDRVERSVVDHMHILEALEARDADRAERLVRDHALGLAAHVEATANHLR